MTNGFSSSIFSKLASAAAILGLTLSGCAPTQPVGTNAPAKDPGIHKTFERGPVTVALHVDRASISIAERLNLTLEARADENYRVELPSLGKKLDPFGIVDYRASEPELIGNNKKRQSRSYVLEPFLSGDYKIPPMTVKFWKEGEEKESHTVETEEVTIKVVSLLPEDAKNLTIHDVTGPADLPRRVQPWAIGAIVGTFLLGATGIALIWAARRKRVGLEKREPPHAIALREIQELVAENLAQRGLIKLFYQRLSEIIRRYIERRFGLHAPEQTTEEFLEGLRNDRTLDKQYRPLLEGFLKHCDLVKFAEHQPQLPEIQQAFDSCKSFILGTRVEEKGDT
jgi:hypothetical protein